MSDQEECRGCKGTGQKLARLTQAQVYGFAMRGQAIPKVECWYCDGTGIYKPSEVAIREQRDEWR